jgi:hypothetical protein
VTDSRPVMPANSEYRRSHQKSGFCASPRSIQATMPGGACDRRVCGVHPPQFCGRTIHPGGATVGGCGDEPSSSVLGHWMNSASL